MKTEIQFGIHAVRNALENESSRVVRMMVCEDRQDKKLQGLINLAKQQGIAVERCRRNTIDSQTEGGVHQGVLIHCKPRPMLGENELFSLLDGLDEAPLLLVLDGVTDPHNLGACLRTADAAGVHAVIAPRDKSAPLNGTAAKVACGAAQTVPYIQVTNLSRTLGQLQQRGIWITGTAGEAESLVYEANLVGPQALVMGAEGSGLRRLTREHCDFLIKIPMAGAVSSLNVSVATGICLFEAVRQRNN